MTTALEGGKGSASRPGRSLNPGKTRYPLYRRLGGPQGRSGLGAENFAPSGIRSSDRPAAAIRYTDWATWPTRKGVLVRNILQIYMAIFWNCSWRFCTRNRPQPSFIQDKTICCDRNHSYYGCQAAFCFLFCLQFIQRHSLYQTIGVQWLNDNKPSNWK